MLSARANHLRALELERLVEMVLEYNLAYVGADVPVVNVDALCGAVEEACRLPQPDGAL